jgi:hypothetical protein
MKFMNKTISYAFQSQNKELIDSCIRDLTTHDWTLTSRIDDEYGITTLVFQK